jgi:hypothetical protein
MPEETADFYSKFIIFAKYEANQLFMFQIMFTVFEPGILHNFPNASSQIHEGKAEAHF